MRGEDVAFGAEFAIALDEIDGQLVDLFEEAKAGGHQRLAGEEMAAGLLVFGHAGTRGDVARADVFFEGQAHDGGHSALSLFCNCSR